MDYWLSTEKLKHNLQISSAFGINKPHTGIYLPAMLWKDMYDFSSDSVLLCLASEHYNAAEYIRDYKEYIKIVNEG